MRPPARAALPVALLLLARRARRTRPEPLPPPPAGSLVVASSRDGAALHVQVGGQDSSDVTMVFVHGFLARTIEFDGQWQHFGEKARLVRYDHRGHGRSDGVTGPLQVADLAVDLLDVLDAVAPTGRVLLVGHSMGGMAVMSLVEQHPELLEDRVAGVALLATGAGHYLADHRVEDAFRWASRRHLLGAALLALRLTAPALERLRPRRTRAVRSAVKRVVFGTADVDPATVGMTQDLLEGPPLSTLAALQGSLLRNDVLGALPRLRDVPVLVLTGADDRLTRPDHSRLMAEALGPCAELVVVPGAGHVVNQTRPTETNAALDRLLARARA